MRSNTWNDVKAKGIRDARGCLRWTGSHTEKGYGKVDYQGKQWRVHRLAWTIRYGPIPDGLNVCHRCDVTDCFEDTHLFLGTQLINIHDMINKGRQPLNKGTYERTDEVRAKMSVAALRRWEDPKERTRIGKLSGASRLSKKRGPYRKAPPRMALCHPDKRHVAHDLCGMCYQRQRKHSP